MVVEAHPLDGVALAWAAGFFDGEGSTTLYAKSRKSMDAVRVPCLTITQCRRATLERFQSVVFEMGRIYGPYQKVRGRPQYLWRTTQFRHAQAVIALLWRFLTPEKQEQALGAFRSYRTSVSTGRLCRNSLHQKPRRYGRCVECRKAARQRWAQKPNVAARLLAYNRNYRAENPARVDAWNAAKRRRRAGGGK